MKAYILIHYMNKEYEKVPDSIDIVDDFWHAILIKEFEDLVELGKFVKELRKKYGLIINTLIEKA